MTHKNHFFFKTITWMICLPGCTSLQSAKSRTWWWEHVEHKLCFFWLLFVCIFVKLPNLFSFFCFLFHGISQYDCSLSFSRFSSPLLVVGYFPLFSKPKHFLKHGKIWSSVFDRDSTVNWYEDTDEELVVNVAGTNLRKYCFFCFFYINILFSVVLFCVSGESKQKWRVSKKRKQRTPFKTLAWNKLWCFFIRAVFF